MLCSASDCGQTFTGYTLLFRHYHAYHVGGVFRCSAPKCRFHSLINRAEVINHQKSVHPEFGYECPSCGKRMKAFDALDQHMRQLHVNEKNQHCIHCGRTFEWESDRLRAHKCIVSNPNLLLMSKRQSDQFLARQASRMRAQQFQSQRKNIISINNINNKNYRNNINHQNRLTSTSSVNIKNCYQTQNNYQQTTPIITLSSGSSRSSSMLNRHLYRQHQLPQSISFNNATLTTATNPDHNNQTKPLLSTFTPNNNNEPLLKTYLLSSQPYLTSSTPLNYYPNQVKITSPTTFNIKKPLMFTSPNIVGMNNNNNNNKDKLSLNGKSSSLSSSPSLFSLSCYQPNIDGSILTSSPLSSSKTTSTLNRNKKRICMENGKFLFSTDELNFINNNNNNTKTTTVTEEPIIN